MKRRLLVLLLAFCLTLGLMTISAVATETEAPTSAPTEAPTEAPTAAPTEAPTEAPTAAPTEAPTEPPVVTSGNCGETMTWSFDTASGTLTISGSGAMDEFKDQPWAHLKDQIKSIRFGADIRSVAEYAFSGCSKVTSIRFTGHVPGTIGKNAFKGITATLYYPGLDPDWASLEKKDYGGDLEWKPEFNGVTGGVFGANFVWTLEGSTLKIVGKGNMGGWESGVEMPPWYKYRNDITKVVMSGHIYCIYTSAFRDMPNLKEVEWPEDLNIIYASAFYNCTGLTKLKIPYSVHTISDYAFYGCTNLSSVDLPKNLKELGRNAFYGCEKLESLSLPDKLQTVGQKAFSHSGLKSIILPAGVTKLRTGTFDNCWNLSSVTVMGNITEIGAECFEKCSKLTTLLLPASLKTIGESAFAESGLKELVFGGNMPTIGTDALKGIKVAVFYPAGNTTWEESRLSVLKKAYTNSVSFYAGTPDNIVEETEAPTQAPTEAPTEAPTQMPTETATEALVEDPTQIHVIPDITEPAEIPTEEPVHIPQEERSVLDYWPVAVAAVWFFGGSALAVWLILIRPRRR